MGLVALTFDLETGMRVASKVGNLSSKIWHASPLGSRIIRYVNDGRTDRRADGRTTAMLIAPFPTVGSITSQRSLNSRPDKIPPPAALQATDKQTKKNRRTDGQRCCLKLPFSDASLIKFIVTHKS